LISLISGLSTQPISGLPFYGYTFQGAAKPDGAIAKKMYGWHKTTGQVFEYFMPVHIGAAGLHVLRRQAIFHRINPFA
jgi:cytochrome b561